MVHQFGLLWLILAAGLGLASMVLRQRMSDRRPSRIFICLFFLVLCVPALLFVLWGFLGAAGTASPFLEVKTITSAKDTGGIIGQDPFLSDIPVLTPFSDDRHALIKSCKGNWTIQNLALKRRLLVRHNGNDVDPHELPLKPGMGFQINRRPFRVFDHIRLPFFARLWIRGPNGKILRAGGFVFLSRSLVISTIGTQDTGAPVLPGIPGQRLAKISYDQVVRWKIPYTARVITFKLPLLEGFLWGVPILTAFFMLAMGKFRPGSITGRFRLAATLIMAFELALIALFYISVNREGDLSSGRFILSHYRSDDKTAAVIADETGQSLLERETPLQSGDMLILGYTYFTFSANPDATFSLIPLIRAPRFFLPKSGPFLLGPETKPWIPMASVSIPVDLPRRIEGEIHRVNDQFLLYLGNSGVPVREIKSGDEFTVQDGSGNRVVFAFKGRFVPASISEWFQTSPALVLSEVWTMIPPAGFLLLLTGIILIACGKIDCRGLPVLAGVILLSGMGALFMFRLELFSIRHDGDALRHISQMVWFGIPVLLLVPLSGYLPREIKKRRLRKSLVREKEKSDYDPDQIDRIIHELERLKTMGKGWEIYTLARKRLILNLNLPCIILVASFLTFLAQRLIGSETGIKLISFDFQPVFLVLVVTAVVLAFGTTTDLAVAEDRVPDLPKSRIGRFYWRYEDLILCFLCFFVSMILLNDFAPLFLFFCLFTAGWFLRTRWSNPATILLTMFFLFLAAILLWNLSRILPHLPDFLDFFNERLLSWIAPFINTFQAGQFIDNMWLLKGAGLNGYGLGGSPQIQSLSQVEDDFILSLIVSDTGLGGLLALFITFALIILPPYLFSTRQSEIIIGFPGDQTEDDRFYRNLCFWLSFMFLLQVLVISGMIIGLLPVMGMPLPFLGRGGSSLVFFSFLSVGLIFTAMSETSRGEHGPQ